MPQSDSVAPSACWNESAMPTKRDFMHTAALGGLAAAGLPLPALAQADRPGILGAKDIAESALIYGLPIVMNYAVMYDLAIDRASPQFKAPFNQIKNETHVATYRDTAVVTPNSDTPYSLAFLDLRAEPIVV